MQFSHYSISHQTVHNKNHHLSKFAFGLSQNLTWNQSIRKIRKKNSHDDYQLSTKTTRDQEDDGIMETI